MLGIIDPVQQLNAPSVLMAPKCRGCARHASVARHSAMDASSVSRSPPATTGRARRWRGFPGSNCARLFDLSAATAEYRCGRSLACALLNATMRFLPISGAVLLLLVNCSSGNKDGDGSVGGFGSFSGTGGQTTGGASASGESGGGNTSGGAGNSSGGAAGAGAGGRTNEGGAASGGSAGTAAGGAPKGGAVGSAGAAGSAGAPGGISCGQTTCGANQYCRAGCCGTPGCDPGPDTCRPLPATCNGAPSCGCICGQGSSFFCKDGGVIQCGCG